MTARFHYPLEPVRLSQQWAHDALLADLAAHNSQVAAQERAVAVLALDLAGTAQQWAMLTAGGALPVERMARLIRYGTDQSARLQQAQDTLAAAAVTRDGVREQVVQSRRRLDALEKHRGRLEATFVQARLAAEFKDADDQWHTRPEGTP